MEICKSVCCVKICQQQQTDNVHKSLLCRLTRTHTHKCMCGYSKRPQICQYTHPNIRVQTA